MGTVSPSDFRYYSIHFDRDVEGADYTNQQPENQVQFSGSIPPGNDTSLPEFRDDIVDDGKIFDLDGPGVNIFGDDDEGGSDVGTVKRQRLNFKQFVVFKDGDTLIRASEIVKWHVAHSFQKQQDGSWVRDETIDGDSGIGEGWLGKLTWNLQ